MRYLLLPFLLFASMTALLQAEVAERTTVVRFLDSQEENGKACEEYHYLSAEQRLQLLKTDFYLGDILRDSLQLESTEPGQPVDANLSSCDSVDAKINALKYTEKVDYLNENIIAIETEQYLHDAGSEHGMLDSAYYLYDRKYGMEIAWESLFGKSRVFDRYVLDRVIKEIANPEYIDYIDSSEQLLNFRVPGYFTINDKGLFIQYGEYEIAPFTSGRPSITVPKAVLKKYMSAEMYHKCFAKKAYVVSSVSKG